MHFKHAHTHASTHARTHARTHSISLSASFISLYYNTRLGQENMNGSWDRVLVFILSGCDIGDDNFY